MDFLLTVIQRRIIITLKGFLFLEDAACCCCQVASVVSDSVRPHGLQPTRILCPWDSPGKNTGVGCHCLLQCVNVKSLSHVRLFLTPWTAAYQAPAPMGFSRQEYWSGLPFWATIPCLITSQLGRVLMTQCP